MGVYDNKLTKLDAFDLKMVFKALILLTCLVSAHAAIKCRTGLGGSAGEKDAKVDINLTDCEEGVTQCKLSGLAAKGLAAFKYGCGEKDKVVAVGCKTGKLTTKCYCTGTKCTPKNPTSSANTIGTQATIGFAVILAFFSKIMA